MAALDFKEIAAAHAGSNRDSFELFAREFLVNEGFEIISGPDRGADDGRDLIVKETRSGIGGQTFIFWLVSCKHKAHSGNSVSPYDESNIRDRIETHNCSGLIAFYSTVPSSGLSTILHALRPKHDLIVYDNETIERKLVASPNGRTLAARFMPVSFNNWVKNSQNATIIVAKDPQLAKSNYFLRMPHSNLNSAREEAIARNLLIFAVIYDPVHPTHSKLDYALGYFMEYQATKRLVDQYFVPILGSCNDPELADLVPEDNPMELCLLVILDRDLNILKLESVYANPEEGLRKVRELIKQVGM